MPYICNMKYMTTYVCMQVCVNIYNFMYTEVYMHLDFQTSYCITKQKTKQRQSIN